MTKLTKTSVAALDAFSTRLSDENVLTNIVEWLADGIEDNRENNTSHSSIRKDWNESWGGDGSSAVSIYAEGSTYEVLLGHSDIAAEVARRLEIEMQSRIDAELETIKAGIMNASNLRHLEAVLDTADEYAEENGLDTEALYDATNLPAFGGDDIDGIGVYSWDETRKLVQTNGEWSLVAR